MSDLPPALVKSSTALAAICGVEVPQMLATIKAQCFRGNPAHITNEQLAAYVSVANEMKVNPFLPGMLYAYPTTGGGIVPIMGPDGVFKKLAERDDIDSYECQVFPEDPLSPPTHAVAKIFLKGRERPLTYTGYFTEWCNNSNPNWKSRPRHMLWLRCIKQVARQVIHGMPGDEDDKHFADAVNVTPATDQAPAPADRPAPPAKGVAAARAANASAKNKPAETVVDGEFSEVKPEEKPVTPPPAQKDQPDYSEKATPAQPNRQSPPADCPTQPRTALADGEKITVTATLRAARERPGKKQNFVVLTLDGTAYAGTAYLPNGPDAQNPKHPLDSPCLVPDTLLALELSGQRSAQNHDLVNTIVTAIALASGDEP